VSSRSARVGLVKPKTIRKDSDCSFAMSVASRSEDHGSFKHDPKRGGPVPQQVWHVKEPLLLKAVSAKHRSKFADLSPVMVTAAR
jgi:hypothetical protein